MLIRMTFQIDRLKKKGKETREREKKRGEENGFGDKFEEIRTVRSTLYVQFDDLRNP